MADDIRSIYATALKNAHAVELQALQITGRQVARLERYPDIKRILRRRSAPFRRQGRQDSR